MIETSLSRMQSLIDLGGPVIAILMAMSVLLLAVTFWKAVVFEIHSVGRGVHRGFVHRILQETRVTAHDADTLRSGLLTRLEAEFGKVASGLRVLDLMSQVAPLLGLFGTVLGMIAAFRTLQEAGGTADPSLLAGGIWVALMTTAAGLVVAMPATLLLGWFDSRLETHERDARLAVEQLINPNVFTQSAAGENNHPLNGLANAQ